MMTKVTLAALLLLVLLVSGNYLDAQRESDFLKWKEAHNCVDISPALMECNGRMYTNAAPD